MLFWSVSEDTNEFDKHNNLKTIEDTTQIGHNYLQLFYIPLKIFPPSLAKKNGQNLI